MASGFIPPQLLEADKEISLKLPNEMTIDVAEDIGTEFKNQFLERSGNVVLDASEVVNITTPGIQLIVSLEKFLTSKGYTLNVTGASEGCICAIRDLGLEHLIFKSL